MLSLTLFAEAGGKPAGSPLERPELIYGTLGLVAALLVGAVAVYLVDRWRKRAALESRAEAGGELTSFRTMYERGEITEAEYARLREKVAARVKNKPVSAAVSTAPMPPSAAPAAPPVPGPLPADYFDDPKLSDQPPPPPNGKPPGAAPPSV